MARYKGLNHLALVTGDMDGTIRFWRDLLGLPLVSGIGDASYRQYFFELSPETLISFFEWPGAEPVEDRDAGWVVKGPIVFDHLCLEVDGEDDLWELKDRLEAAGFWVTEVVDNGFVYSFFTSDPNGITVEIGANVEGRDLREPPRMLDPDASTVTREGAAPQRERWPAPSPTAPADRRVHPGGLKKLTER